MNYGDELTLEMQRMLDDEMRPGETLVWSGRRVGIRGLVLRGAFMGVFGLFFAGFAVFWMAMAFLIAGEVEGGSFGIFFPLFGLPFLLIGTAVATSPYRMWRSAKRSFYAITNQRAITFEGAMFGAVTIKSYAAEDLSEMKRSQFSDGMGDLIFRDYTTYYTGRRGRRRRRQIQEGFLGITRVAEVERKLRAALNME